MLKTISGLVWLGYGMGRALLCGSNNNNSRYNRCLRCDICSVGVMSGIDRETLSSFQFGKTSCIHFTLHACTYISVK